jgi:carbonic anhydrase
MSFEEKSMSDQPISAETTSLETSSTVTRRNWLGGMLAAGVYAAPAVVMTSTMPAQDRVDAVPQTPQEALSRLYEGNARFVAGNPLEAHRDKYRMQEIAAGQKPFAAFLGCADSRVPIEFVFDQGFGDLFVTRIAGNVASSENVGSLEFGTLVLGAKVLYILGHSSCGAVAATAERSDVPGQISGLFQHIRPAVKLAKGNVELAIIENVRHQAMVLAESSPVIARLIREKSLIVAGGVYDLKSGKVTPVELPDLT